MPANPPAVTKLLASGAVSVDFDVTFIAQFLLITTFIVILKPLLFDPLMRVFEERERRTDGAKADARAMDARAGELLTKYEAELEKVRRAAATDRDRVRAATVKLEAQIMSEARVESAKILDEGKAKITKEIEALRTDLRAAEPQLAADIASRILGREVTP